MKSVGEKELEKLMIELHSLQLKLQKPSLDDGDLIKKKLEGELNKRKEDGINVAVIQAKLQELQKENDELKQYCVNLQSEIYGARLAAKYLDKELAGRIQQIQLLGKDLKPADHERLWNQLEAEIHLHRHKTVIRACRGKRYQANNNNTQQQQQQHQSVGNNNNNNHEEKLAAPPNHDFQSLKRRQGVGDVRTVLLKKEPKEGLGIR